MAVYAVQHAGGNARRRYQNAQHNGKRPIYSYHIYIYNFGGQHVFHLCSPFASFTIEVASKDFNKMKEKFLLVLMEQTTNKPSKKPLMKDFLKQWLAEKKLTVKESTYKIYVDMIQYNVMPAFANTLS